MYLIVRNGASQDVQKTRLTEHPLGFLHCLMLTWTDRTIAIGRSAQDSLRTLITTAANLHWCIKLDGAILAGARLQRVTVISS